MYDQAHSRNGIRLHKLTEEAAHCCVKGRTQGIFKHSVGGKSVLINLIHVNDHFLKEQQNLNKLGIEENVLKVILF